MDRLDYLILAELHKDASKSFVEIAESINATPCTVRRRYERMKRDGKIMACNITINFGRLGYQGKAFLLISLVPNCDKSETMAFVRKIKNVFVVMEIIGPCDFIAMAPITDLASIQTLLEEVKKAPNIQKVEFYCTNDVYFPIGPKFDEALNQKCQSIAKKL
jgi:DNA-binding Lrp family transcriptional regulator